MITPDDSFALKDKVECARRENMLLEPHMQPLLNYLKDMREALGADYEMPMFDPCDGGINARVLILLEAPGPKAVGSQFISRNNPDRTAENINNLLQKAEIPRADTILWNIVPWYIGDGKKIRSATKEDVKSSLPFLKKLIELLTNLDFIVLMGKPAQSAELEIKKITSKLIYCTAHPSPKVANIYPPKMLKTQQQFNDISSLLKYLAPQNFIANFTTEDIDKLLAFLPVFSNPDFKPYVPIKRDFRPFFKYDFAIDAFSELLREPCWSSDCDPIVAGKMFKNESLLKNADLVEIKQMLRYFDSQDKWVDGAKGQFIIDGHLQRLLERLKQLRNTI